MVDVYDTEVQPSSVKQDGEMVILSNVRLNEAPDGKHPVSVSMSIDDREFDSETLNLAKTESQSISFNLKANNLTQGIHNVTVEASVEGSSDKETKELEIEETPQFVLIDDVGVSPISICNDENEELFLFARIKSQLPDSSKIKAMFFVKDNSGKFVLAGDDEEILDENEDDMLSVRYGIKPFQLDPGMHEAKIIVQGEGRDTEFTKFVVKDCGGKSIEDLLSSKPDHCLVVEDVWVEDRATPQKNVDVRAKISNCGKNTERNIIASLQAFRKSYYSPIFSLGVNQTKDMLFTVYTPADLSRIFKMSAFATNKYVSDSLIREFNSAGGLPLIQVQNQYDVFSCETNKIKFWVTNKGESDDAFELKVLGETGEWFLLPSTKVYVKSNEVKPTEATVDVPCDAEEKIYQFTLTVAGQVNYSITSSLNVKKRLTLPDWLWLMILFFILVIVILWFAFKYDPHKGRRRHESF